VDALAASDPGTCWDRLVFCAKEAVYKTWFPLAERWLGFDEADVTIDAAARSPHGCSCRARWSTAPR
jgi:4'-phosphopantetheinyl transferase EntD